MNKPQTCPGCGKPPKDGCARVDCPSRRAISANLGDGRSTINTKNDGTYRAVPTKGSD